MTITTWPYPALSFRRAARLTLAFWAFTFFVFQITALKTGRITLWETTGYLIVVAVGVVLSLLLYGLIRLSHRCALRLRITLIGVGALTAASAHSVIDHEALIACARAFNAPARMPPLIEGFVFNILIYVWIYVLYVTVAWLIMTTTAMRDQERRLAAATAAAQEAQLTALRFQINPHFLFNSLNAVTSLISSGRSLEAEMVVMRLSDFFRASLATSPGDLVRLEEELDAAGSYLDIEAARFGDRMRVDISLPDDLRDALVPHFLLQPLVENAVKHGVAMAKHQVAITIRAIARQGRLLLSVHDDADVVAISQPATNRTGVGLANVMARIQTLFGDRGSLATFKTSGGFAALIEIPLQLDQGERQVAA